MARILSPDDYGLTALPAVFFAVASVFIDSGFSQALVRKADVTEKDLSTSFYYSLIVGLSCFLAIFFCSPLIADFYNVPILESMIKVTALTFLWGPLNTPQSVILQRKLDFKTPARISVVSKIIGAIIGVVFAYLGYGVWALVLMSVLSSFLGFVQTWIAVRWFPRERWSKDSFKYLWNFGNKIILTFVIDKIYANIAPVLIGKYYSPADLGQYNRAQGYANLPSVQATSVLQSVSFPVLSKVQGDKEALAKHYRSMIRTSTYVVMPIMVCLSALSYPIVVCLVGEKWIPCVAFLQVMCLTRSMYPLHSLNVNLLMVRGRSDLYLKLEIVKKVIGVLMLAITLPMGLMCLVWGYFFFSIINLFLNTYYTGKLIKVGLLVQLGDIMHVILLSATMYLCISLSIMFIQNLYLQIFVGVFVGAVVYVGGSKLFKFKEVNDVMYMLNKKI